jgi:protein-tyrosine phosphatase
MFGRARRGQGEPDGEVPALPESVVVVCIGNICRSPMGEALLASRLRALGCGTRVSSAGIGAMVGMPADPLSIVLMEEMGLDIGAHRGRQLDPSRVDAHTLLLVMSDEQRRWILKRRRDLAGRVARFGRWGEGDIADPVGRGRQEFEAARDAIVRALDGWCRAWRLDGRGGAP